MPDRTRAPYPITWGPAARRPTSECQVSLARSFNTKFMYGLVLLSLRIPKITSGWRGGVFEILILFYNNNNNINNNLIYYIVFNIIYAIYCL